MIANSLPSLPFSFFAESVKALLGRHTKILVKYVVKLETKGDKTENRVLVSTISEVSVCNHFCSDSLSLATNL